MATNRPLCIMCGTVALRILDDDTTKLPFEKCLKYFDPNFVPRFCKDCVPRVQNSGRKLTKRLERLKHSKLPEPEPVVQKEGQGQGQGQGPSKELDEAINLCREIVNEGGRNEVKWDADISKMMDFYSEIELWNDPMFQAEELEVGQRQDQGQGSVLNMDLEKGMNLGGGLANEMGSNDFDTELDLPKSMELLENLTIWNHPMIQLKKPEVVAQHQDQGVGSGLNMEPEKGMDLAEGLANERGSELKVVQDQEEGQASGQSNAINLGEKVLEETPVKGTRTRMLKIQVWKAQIEAMKFKIDTGTVRMANMCAGKMLEAGLQKLQSWEKKLHHGKMAIDEWQAKIDAEYAKIDAERAKIAAKKGDGPKPTPTPAPK